MARSFKPGHTRAGQRHQFEILTGRVETSQHGGEAFAVVRDLDPYAKSRVQAILRRCGRGQDTDLTILSDGEDGLRGMVGTWFGKKCQNRLDWFHIARRITRIEKEFLYLPYGPDFLGGRNYFLQRPILMKRDFVNETKSCYGQDDRAWSQLPFIG
jgi:hypothetical protein